MASLSKFHDTQTIKMIRSNLFPFLPSSHPPKILKVIIQDLTPTILFKVAWNGLPCHYPHVLLDAWIIMPNHIHGIIVINDGVNRDESEFNRIREYVTNNPARWDKDEENPAVANVR